MNAISFTQPATEVEILRREIEKLTQKLAGRGILERAKGILQAEFGWTEEEAYLHVRRLSRQNRVPMRQIAANVIASREASLGREAVSIGREAVSIGREAPIEQEERRAS